MTIRRLLVASLALPALALVLPAGAQEPSTAKLEAYVQAHPQSAKARKKLGIAYFGEHRYREAARELKEVLQLARATLSDAGKADIERSIALASFKAGDHAGARAAIEDALTHAPDDPKVQKVHKAILARAGTGAAAGPAPGKSGTGKESFATGIERYKEAVSLKVSGQARFLPVLNQAIAGFKDAAASGYKAAESHYYLGCCLLLKGKKELDQARKELEESRKLDPNDARSHLKLGEVYGALNLAAEEKQSLLESHRLDPTTPEVNFRLALLFDRSKEKADAQRSFDFAREAITADPSYKALLKQEIKNIDTAFKIDSVPVPRDPEPVPSASTQEASAQSSTAAEGDTATGGPEEKKADGLDDVVKKKTGKGIDDWLEDKRVKRLLEKPSIQKRLKDPRTQKQLERLGKKYMGKKGEEEAPAEEGGGEE